jgi:hypothetical protein
MAKLSWNHDWECNPPKRVLQYLFKTVNDLKQGGSNGKM